jgi:hypothetical protein
MFFSDVFVFDVRVDPMEQTRTDVCCNTPFSPDEALRRYLLNLESGVMPNVLEMMAIISTVSEVMTPFDQKPTRTSEKYFEMSQKNCRFCD